MKYSITVWTDKGPRRSSELAFRLDGPLRVCAFRANMDDVEKALYVTLKEPPKVIRVFRYPSRPRPSLIIQVPLKELGQSNWVAEDMGELIIPENEALTFVVEETK